MSKKIDNQTYFNSNQAKPWANPPIVVAWKFSSAENLGALLRVCDNFGVKQVFFVGNQEDYKLSRIKRNATTSINKVNWSFITKDEIWEAVPENFVKIAVDTTTESIAINEFDFNTLSSFCLFFGNETIGLENETISDCDSSVHIPMIGDSYSMNVVQSAAVTLFEASKQCLLKFS